MSEQGHIDALEARVRELEHELKRVTSQRNKAWKSRKEIHDRLRAEMAKNRSGGR